MRPIHVWRSRTPAGVRCTHFPSVITTTMDHNVQLLNRTYVNCIPRSRTQFYYDPGPLAPLVPQQPPYSQAVKRRAWFVQSGLPPLSGSNSIYRESNKAVDHASMHRDHVIQTVYSVSAVSKCLEHLL
jgi:hypothetical protein